MCVNVNVSHVMELRITIDSNDVGVFALLCKSA